MSLWKGSDLLKVIQYVRGTASLGPGLWPPSLQRKEEPAEWEDQVNRRKSACAAERGLDWKGHPGPYRMQVTEAACWSFMLFLRSRMLSEDWYTWTLWIRGVYL